MLSLREGLNFDISKLSRRSSKLEFERQEEIMVKSLGQMLWKNCCEWERTLERESVASFLPVNGETPLCSEIKKIPRVWPKYNALEHWQKYLQIIRNLINLGVWSWKGKKRDNRLPDWKMKRTVTCGKAEHIFVIWFRICKECEPVKGKEQLTTVLSGVLEFHQGGLKSLSRKSIIAAVKENFRISIVQEKLFKVT